MQTAIGYVRVSTEDQASEGVSLDAQKAKLAAWCLANDYELSAALVVELRDRGLSLRDIASHLTQTNIPTKKGNTKWNHMTVKSVLHRVA